MEAIGDDGSGYVDNSIRFLRGNGLKTDVGPIAVLAVVCLLFCFVWMPMLCHRRFSAARGHYFSWGSAREQRNAERQAEIIRISLENLRRLGFGDGNYNYNGHRHQQGRVRPEDRRDFINNVLVSRKILTVSKEGPPTDDGDWDDLTVKSSSGNNPCRKTSLLLADVVNTSSTTKLVSVEPCPICLNDYVEGDVLCWSQNSACKHCFHKECALEWLMNHEECPLCRHNYLSLDGDDTDEDPMNDIDRIEGQRPTFTTHPAQQNDDEAYSFFRTMHLFYILSQLQSLADARPNTTISLEGVELSNGQQGNVEIQRATEESSTLDVHGRGMNIRVVPLGNENSTVSESEAAFLHMLHTGGQVTSGQPTSGNGAEPSSPIAVVEGSSRLSSSTLEDAPSPPNENDATSSPQ